MGKQKRYSLAAMLLTILLLFTACGGGATSSESPAATTPGSTADTPAEGSSDAPAAPAGDMPDEIRIGLVGAMSGPSAVLGKASAQGAEWAVKEINEAGGINGVPVRLIVRDDEADPTKSKTYIEELVEKEKVQFIIGPTNSTPASATVGYMNENKIINILSSATSTPIVDETTIYTFRTVPHNELQAKALVKLAADRGYDKVALVADTSALGVDGMAVMKATCEEMGVNVVAEIPYKVDDQDMTPVAQKIKDSGADGGLFWALGADAAKIVRALERLDYINSIKIHGYTGMMMSNFRDLAGDGASQCTALALGYWTLAPGEDQLEDRLWEKYETIVSEFGEYGPGGRDTNPINIIADYDSVMMIKWAVETANSVDPDALREVFETRISEYKPYYSTHYTFTKDNHNGYPVEGMAAVVIGEMKGELFVRSE